MKFSAQRLTWLSAFSFISIFGNPSLNDLINKQAAVQDIFSAIYQTHYWGNKETLSGPGSTLQSTKAIRMALPELFENLHINVIVDAPCGDFNWMKEVDLGGRQYIGVDVVPFIVEKNQQLYGNGNRRFICLDVTADMMPKADLIICRDCLAHLSYEKAFAAIALFKKSGAKYLLVTTHRAVKANELILTGQMYPYNLQLPPFNFPEPVGFIDEISAESMSRAWRKSFGLWRLEDINLSNN